jgi:tetratricopeptide (TPR) repeat protein
MKARTLIILGLCTALPMAAFADKKKKAEPAAPVQEAVEEDNNVITEECLTNVSLFHESAKNKQYADAWEPWEAAYKECPSASVNIYIDGDKIVEWKISQTKPGTEDYDKYRALLLTLHDKRIKYFGKDPKYMKKYPVASILGQKGLDYCTFYPEDPLKAVAYPWLKESVEGMGLASSINVAVKLADVSYELYKSDPDKYAEQYIADYQLVSGVLAAVAADPANKNASAAASNKEYVDQRFAVSGAADCGKLDELYDKVVKENLNNLEMLNKIMALYRRIGCTNESDVYFAAAESAHKLSPTSESAAGCASMCKKKEDWAGAIEYYNQATDLSDVDQDKADYQYNAAFVYYNNLKNYSASRSCLNKSLEYVPNQGRCYILMGLMYAASKPYTDGSAKAAILNKTVYWVAVDKFVKARSVDPTCADDANKLISTYSKYFPTKEERFDLPGEFGGGTFCVGGWIGECTTVR